MAVDLFLKLSKSGAPIKGECQDLTFQGMIQLRSFQMSSLSLLAQGGADAGGDACSFTIKKLLDGSSTDLFLNYTQAQSPEKRKSCLLRGTVFVRSDGPQAKGTTPESVSFLALEFFDVFVYDYSLEGNQEDPRPVEEVKFYFDKYQMTYREPYAADGVSLKAPRCVGWNFEADAPL
jgi:type VI protein secretion system component Hcp